MNPSSDIALIQRAFSRVLGAFKKISPRRTLLALHILCSAPFNDSKALAASLDCNLDNTRANIRMLLKAGLLARATAHRNGATFILTPLGESLFAHLLPKPANDVKPQPRSLPV